MPRHRSRPLPRTGRGRGWFSKRWIYWRRRYSNPTLRDRVMLVILLTALASVLSAFVSFRITGVGLAGLLAAMGLLRLLGGPWAATVRNRGTGFDATVLFLAAAALGLLTLAVPLTR